MNLLKKFSKLGMVFIPVVFFLLFNTSVPTDLSASSETVAHNMKDPVISLITPADLIEVICSKYRMSYQDYLNLKEKYLNQRVEWRIEIKEIKSSDLLIGQVKASDYCRIDVYCSGRLSDLAMTILPGTSIKVAGRLVDFSYNMVTGEGRIKLDAVKLSK